MNDLSIKTQGALDYHLSLDLWSAPGLRERYDHLFPMLMNHLHLDRLEGRKVLDLACGPGWWGQALMPYGADVHFLDKRRENIERLWREVPNARVTFLDLEVDFPLPKADIILAMSIIYHIDDPRQLFRKIAAATDRVIVDTTVLDHDGDIILHCRERSDANMNSISGAACRPSPAWVVRELKEAGFAHVRDISHPCGNLPPMPGYSGMLYDWEFQRTGGWRRNERTLRKMFMASRHAADDLLK